MDLAEGHVAAVKLVLEDDKLGCKPVSLGKPILSVSNEYLPWWQRAMWQQ
jgi:hypothetical protein